MSALTLLSVIAPAVPSVPQGPSDEAASGFRALLAALSGEAAPGLEGKSPAETSMPDETQGEAEVDAPAVEGFLAAPTAPPTPLVLPAANAADDLDGEQTTTPLPVDKDQTSTTIEPEVLPREQTSTPLLTDKGPTTKPPRPEVLPPLPDVRPATGETSETELTLAGTAAATEALEARARTGATAAPSSPLPAVPPAALRPLAERTSRPLDAPVAKTGEAARATDPARPAPAIVSAAPSVPVNQTAGPTDFAASLAARERAGGGAADGETPERPLPVESGTTQTQAPTGARETGVSQLSRATIEATAQIAAQILRRLEGRSTRFEMALTPDELGRVDVKLDIDSEGRLQARLAFDNPAAATDLRGRADELRRQLEDAGFHLAKDAFEFAERDSGSSAFDRGQDARKGSSRAFAAATRLNTEIDVAQPPRWLALSLSPSGVDMKV